MNLSYGLWLHRHSGMHETVYTSKTHKPIQLRSSSKQRTCWWTTRNLFEILCNGRRHNDSYSFLSRTLVVYKDWCYFILSLVLSGLVEGVGHDAWLAWLCVLQLISQVYICILLFFFCLIYFYLWRKKKKLKKLKLLVLLTFSLYLY